MSKEQVNHPSHYNSHPFGVECINIAEHYGFNLGNAMKYVWRAGLKGSPEKEYEDIKKARWYCLRAMGHPDSVGDTGNDPFYGFMASYHALPKPGRELYIPPSVNAFIDKHQTRVVDGMRTAHTRKALHCLLSARYGQYPSVPNAANILWVWLHENDPTTPQPQLKK